VPAAKLAPMPLAKSTIATVGSGVMAEAMIAGLLRGKQIAPNRIIASHPRADRRSELISTYGISTVEDNASAVEKADVVVLAIKPQMLARVGREIAPALKRGKLVISIIAGATTTALINALGHEQIVRSMPNTPAQLGNAVSSSPLMIAERKPNTISCPCHSAGAIGIGGGSHMPVNTTSHTASASGPCSAPSRKNGRKPLRHNGADHAAPPVPAFTRQLRSTRVGDRVRSWWRVARAVAIARASAATCHRAR